ncbi:hypothetical protein DPMN_122671 [Dreissena polymorpha]|uniref:Uncharacterized protein n=1 Tax=Dreissena polymorpha TaxID=45954 RepID=A0A9D4GVZ4_DREPO|nr:hypothetical protein DPMN_122671 [Dreissena polymorpha]
MPQGHSSEMYTFDATASFYTGTKPKRMNGNQRPSNAVHSTRTRKDEVKCVFCDDSHSTTECKKITSVNERRKIVKGNQLCFNCLGKHFVAQCTSKGRCRKCKRKHYTNICDRKSKSASHNSTSENPSHDASVLHTTTKVQTGVLLKTAQASVSSTMLKLTFCLMMVPKDHV